MDVNEEQDNIPKEALWVILRKINFTNITNKTHSFEENEITVKRGCEQMNKKEDTTKTLSEDGWKILKEAFEKGLKLSDIFEELNLNSKNIGNYSTYNDDGVEFGEVILANEFETYLINEQGTLLYESNTEYISDFMKKVSSIEAVPEAIAEIIGNMTSRDTGKMVQELKQQYTLRTFCEELKLAGIINDFNEEKL